NCKYLPSSVGAAQGDNNSSDNFLTSQQHRGPLDPATTARLLRWSESEYYYAVAEEEAVIPPKSCVSSPNIPWKYLNEHDSGAGSFAAGGINQARPEEQFQLGTSVANLENDKSVTTDINNFHLTVVSPVLVFLKQQITKNLVPYSEQYSTSLLRFTKHSTAVQNRFGTTSPDDLDQEVRKGQIFVFGSNKFGQLGVGCGPDQDVE
ncbi:unnamed protein product, partial [Amoebophrya sp. A120]